MITAFDILIVFALGFFTCLLIMRFVHNGSSMSTKISGTLCINGDDVYLKLTGSLDELRNKNIVTFVTSNIDRE